MTCGDIVLAYKQDIADSKIYLAYDKNVVLGANLFDFEIKSLQQLKIENYNLSIFHPKYNISYTKKRKLGDILQKIFCKQTKLSFKERIHFIKYVVYLYSTIFNIELIEHPSFPVDALSIAQSTQLIQQDTNDAR